MPTALDAWRITPRMLRAVVDRDLGVEVCGTLMAAPVLLAPVGGLGVVRPDGERQVARVATELGLPMVVSTVSSTSLEDVARELAGGPAWFQLYWPRQREVAASLVRRAEAAGFRAIVVTVDTWALALAWRPRDLANGYLPFLAGEGIANYLTDPAFRAGLARPPEDDPGAAVPHWAANFGNPTLRWSDVAWLREQTRLPVLVKGICHPDDARAAADAGADGVIVSNHGGRQLDAARAAFDCLPHVVAAAGATGALRPAVRSGSDIIKALAMGVRAVLVGRSYV